MNFDRLAAHYHWMETFFAGGLMQRCRTRFLSRTRNCRHALLVGEGTGKFLAELLRGNPQIRVTCIEHSQGMIEQMRRRLSAEKLDGSRVEFKQADARHWPPPREKFDLVATHFFLDCFRDDQLRNWCRGWRTAPRRTPSGWSPIFASLNAAGNAGAPK